MAAPTDREMNMDAICVFHAPMEPLTLKVAIDDIPRLINTVVGQTSWTLVSIQLPQTETKEDRKNPEASL